MIKKCTYDDSPEPEHSVSFAGCTEGSAHQLSSVYRTNTSFCYNLEHKLLKARFNLQCPLLESCLQKRITSNNS